MRRRPVDIGAVLLAVAAAASAVVSIYDYFASAAIGHTGGVLLVIAASIAVLVGALVVMLVAVWRWLHVLIDILLVLGIVGSAAAAWFLEADVLVALMAVALVGWLVHVVVGASPRRIRAEAAA